MSKELRNLVENHTGSAWGAEQQTRYDELARDIESTDAEIARNQRVLDEASLEFGRVQNRADHSGLSTDEAHANVTMEKSIFNTWLREGQGALNEQQRQYVAQRAASVRNDMSTDVASGGYLVPTDFATQLIEALKAFGGMRPIATVIGTGTGQQIQWPTIDATAQEGEIVGQNTLVGAQDFAFGMKEINAYKFSSKSVAVPIELLQDSRIDLEATSIPRSPRVSPGSRNASTSSARVRTSRRARWSRLPSVLRQRMPLMSSTPTWLSWNTRSTRHTAVRRRCAGSSMTKR